MRTRSQLRGRARVRNVNACVYQAMAVPGSGARYSGDEPGTPHGSQTASHCSELVRAARARGSAQSVCREQLSSGNRVDDRGRDFPPTLSLETCAGQPEVLVGSYPLLRSHGNAWPLALCAGTPPAPGVTVAPGRQAEIPTDGHTSKRGRVQPHVPAGHSSERGRRQSRSRVQETELRNPCPGLAVTAPSPSSFPPACPVRSGSITGGSTAQLKTKGRNESPGRVFLRERARGRVSGVGQGEAGAHAKLSIYSVVAGDTWVLAAPPYRHRPGLRPTALGDNPDEGFEPTNPQKIKKFKITHFLQKNVKLPLLHLG